MTLDTKEVIKPKVKKKHNWMLGFVIPKRKDPLELAQLESRTKILNDFKRNTYRR
jgi:hypothetical protein